MKTLSRWCIARRWWVVAAWVALAIAVTMIANSAGRDYSTNFTLPGTQSQQAQNLLQSDFPQQSGDSDTIVFHTTTGTVDSPAVEAAIRPLLAKVAAMPDVVAVVSPYSQAGAGEVSADGRTAFATIAYDKRANQLPDNTGAPVLDAVRGIQVPGLQVAAGGEVMENAEGSSIGPATDVGVIAALAILLLTFGSLLAAGLPLITAGAGLVTGIGLIGLATHISSMSSVAPDLAIMIGLGVGVDYALFIVSRFRENYARLNDVREAVVEAMNTSGRAILLAGTTVIIALLGMFATGVAFMDGLSIAAVLAVLLVLAASMTLLPALLSRFGHRIVRPRRSERRRKTRLAAPRPPRPSFWLRWSRTLQAHPRSLAACALAVMVVCSIPFFSLRLDNSDAGSDPASTSTYQAFHLLSDGFGAGFNGPLLIVAELSSPAKASALDGIAAAVDHTPDVAAVTRPVISPDGKVAVIKAFPDSAPQAQATTQLVQHLRDDVLPPLRQKLGAPILVGGFTAGSIDFSSLLAGKLPIFIAIVIVLSALLLFVIFRSLVIPIQAGLMNLLSIGGALGATVAAFQWGWLSSRLGITPGPMEPWMPILMFAVVFGLSMDYEIFLVSRVREEWDREHDASTAVSNGITFTGRVITAAAAIMVCVFFSFLLGDERTIKEFGFGLATAIFLDAIVVRCILLPAVLHLLGPVTWKLPAPLERRLPHLNVGPMPDTASKPVGADGPAGRDLAASPAPAAERTARTWSGRTGGR
jgi:putative drug exporter of the RND superfamily